MKRVLIVVDMQNDFVDGALGTKEAALALGSVVAKIECFDGRVIATMDTHQQDYLETAEGKKLPVPHCIKGTYGWELNEKVREALEKKDYRTVEKGTFGSVSLAQELLEAWEEEPFEAELVGLCTDICVISNALLLKAYIPQMRILVDAACCAGVTPKTHQAALETMKMCQIDVIEDRI